MGRSLEPKNLKLTPRLAQAPTKAPVRTVDQQGAPILMRSCSEPGRMMPVKVDPCLIVKPYLRLTLDGRMMLVKGDP